MLAILLDFLLSPWCARCASSVSPSRSARAWSCSAARRVVGYGGYRTWPARRRMYRGHGAGRASRRFEEKLRSMRGSVEQVTEAAEQVEQATTSTTRGPSRSRSSGPSLTRQLFGGTAAFLGAATVVIFLTYFLLAVGDLFLQKLVARAAAVQGQEAWRSTIARETEAQISLYLFTTTLDQPRRRRRHRHRACTCSACRIRCSGVWSRRCSTSCPTSARWPTSCCSRSPRSSPSRTPAGRCWCPARFWLNLIESNLVTPLIYGNRMRLNTVALFIGLVFWWYIWGIPGAILAVPIMATIKIVCDHIESLAPVGEFLGK